MKSQRNRFLLDESDTPTHWYNILADVDVQESDVRRLRPVGESEEPRSNGMALNLP